MTRGAAYETEDLAKASARTELNPFVVKLPDGGGYAWFPAGTAWFGTHAEVPQGSRMIASWEWKRGEGRKHWECVKFGKSRPGPT